MHLKLIEGFANFVNIAFMRVIRWHFESVYIAVQKLIEYFVLSRVCHRV